MEKTEKKYWVNGHQVRGGYFHSFTMSLFFIGIMLSYNSKTKNTYLSFYKLTK